MRLLAPLFLLLALLPLRAQKYEWIARGESPFHTQVVSMALDSSDNPIVLLQHLGGLAVCDARDSVVARFTGETHWRRYALLKYSPEGELLWTREIYTSASNTHLSHLNDLCVDKAGAIYLTGAMGSRTLFASSRGVDTLEGGWGEYYGFAVKYSGEGDVVWSREVPSLRPCDRICTDGDAAVYFMASDPRLYGWGMDFQAMSLNGDSLWQSRLRDGALPRASRNSTPTLDSLEPRTSIPLRWIRASRERVGDGGVVQRTGYPSATPDVREDEEAATMQALPFPCHYNTTLLRGPGSTWILATPIFDSLVVPGGTLRRGEYPTEFVQELVYLQLDASLKPMWGLVGGGTAAVVGATRILPARSGGVFVASTVASGATLGGRVIRSPKNSEIPSFYVARIGVGLGRCPAPTPPTIEQAVPQPSAPAGATIRNR